MHFTFTRCLENTILSNISVQLLRFSLSATCLVNLEMQCLAHRRLLSVSRTQHTNDFALYTEAIKFFNHPESMVRIAVRTITLNVYKGEHTCTHKPVHLLINMSSGDAGTAYGLFLVLPSVFCTLFCCMTDRSVGFLF